MIIRYIRGGGGLRGPGWGEPNGGYGIKMGRGQTLRTPCLSSNLKVLKVIIVQTPSPSPISQNVYTGGDFGQIRLLGGN